MAPGALTATSSYCSGPRIPVEPQGDTVVTLVCTVESTRRYCSDTRITAGPTGDTAFSLGCQ